MTNGGKSSATCWNCTAVDGAAGTASGYLAPPCRSMTKLFNFRLIESWDGAVTHVLANGTIKFKPGYDASLRLDLHEKLSWEESHFRCLHTCFVPRSSLDAGAALARPNVSGNRRGGITTLARKMLNRLLGKPGGFRLEAGEVCAGSVVSLDVRQFFPEAAGLAEVMSGRALRVGFVIDGLLPRWPRVWQWLRGCPSGFRRGPDAIWLDRAGLARGGGAGGPLQLVSAGAPLRCGGLSQVDECRIATPGGGAAGARNACDLRRERLTTSRRRAGRSITAGWRRRKSRPATRAVRGPSCPTH